MLGLDAIVSPAGTAAELFSFKFERDRNLARSSHVGTWTPGVVTVDVGAVENPFDVSEVREVPKDSPWPELVEFSDMQDMEPFPVPLYVLALVRLAFTSDCDDAMRWSPAASRARPLSLSGCSRVLWALIGICAISAVFAMTCMDSDDEFAMMLSVLPPDMAGSRPDA
jgi:hypothetical protein